jgi:Prophage CP4-57 regulatory protein (AlpA)
MADDTDGTDDFAVVGWNALKQEFGWPYSRAHTWRMMNAGTFPKSFKLGTFKNSHPAWFRVDIRNFFKRFRK